MIPKNPVDINKVDPGVLASLCLAAHQEVSRYHSEALMWWRMKEIKMNSEFAIAMSSITPATNADKKAKSDDSYVRAANLNAKGEAITRFYENIKKNFEAGHYWAEKTKSQKTTKRKWLAMNHIV